MQNHRFAAIDQGTTSTRIAVFDNNGAFQTDCSRMSISHKQITPKTGWVEHDAEEILANIKKCIASCGSVDAIGLCHQGESIVAWNAETGKPIYNAIIWQDMRTEDVIQKLKQDGREATIKKKTGLPLDPYFSASKMGWILKNIEGAKELAEKGKLRIGTMDSYFLDSLTGNFFTDYNSASRTSLFNIHTLKWDKELCKIFGVPIHCLAEIKDTVGHFGEVEIDGHSTPVTASLIDQFAGIYGHGCRNKGDAKVTLGTGAFVQSLSGNEIYDVGDTGLVPTLCWKFPDEEAVFGLDGGVYNAASAVNWAKSIGLFSSYSELEGFSERSAAERGLMFVPALSGLGCPYWDRTAAGIWTGLSLETSKKDMLQSLLEGIAVRTTEVIEAMDNISPLGGSVNVDGGLSVNGYFRQFLADISGKTIISPVNKEITAFGVAMLARKGLGNDQEIKLEQKVETTEPRNIDRKNILNKYKEIIARSRGLRE
ncbi:MAG: glycerol kinase [Kordiimonadaceae bacterium]|jgi:glycerol kinase|nr:glycerol kinase [Kordiimonadaceae bacterium]MBT6031893.1 glycerol kinase [Kordiimonadaceae bacterium]